MGDNASNVDITIRTTAEGDGAKQTAEQLREVGETGKQAGADAAAGQQTLGKEAAKASFSMKEGGKSIKASLMLLKAYKLFLAGDFMGAVKAANFAMRGLMAAMSGSVIGIAIVAITVLAGVLLKLKSSADHAAEALQKEQEQMKPLAGGMDQVKKAAKEAAEKTDEFAEAQKRAQEQIAANIEDIKSEKEALDKLRDIQKQIALEQIAIDETKGKLSPEQAEQRKYKVERAFAADSQKRTQALIQQQIHSEQEKEDAATDLAAKAKARAAEKEKALHQVESQDVKLERERLANEDRIKELQHTAATVRRGRGKSGAEAMAEKKQAEAETDKLTARNADIFEIRKKIGSVTEDGKEKSGTDKFSEAIAAKTKADEEALKAEETSKKQKEESERQKKRLEREAQDSQKNFQTQDTLERKKTTHNVIKERQKAAEEKKREQEKEQREQGRESGKHDSERLAKETIDEGESAIKHLDPEKASRYASRDAVRRVREAEAKVKAGGGEASMKELAAAIQSLTTTASAVGKSNKDDIASLAAEVRAQAAHLAQLSKGLGAH